MKTKIRDLFAFVDERQRPVDITALQERGVVERRVRVDHTPAPESTEPWPEFEDEAEESRPSMWDVLARPRVFAALMAVMAVPVAVALVLILSSSNTEPPVRAEGGSEPAASQAGDAPVATPAGDAPVATEPAADGTETALGATEPDVVVGGEGDGGEPLLVAPPGSVFRFDPETNQIAAVIDTPYESPLVAVGEGTVWVSEWVGNAGRTVSQIDPETNRLVRTVGIVGDVMDMAIGEGSVWVTSTLGGEGVLVEIDAESGRVRRTINLGYSPVVVDVCCWEWDNHTSMSVAVGAGAVWVAATGPERDVALRIEPTTGEVVATIPLSGQPVDVVVGEGGVWLVGAEPEDSQEGKGTLWRIDPDTNDVVATIELPDSVKPGVATGAGAVWLHGGDYPNNTVLRIDPATNQAAATIPAPGRDGEFAFGRGSLWVAANEGGTIARFDPNTGEVTATVQGDCNCSIAFGAGGVWGS